MFIFKSMVLRKLVNYLEDKVPIFLQESYDNCGLLLGNPEEEIEGALICLDITEEIIYEAIEIGANLIISHHPLIFNGIKNLNPEEANHRIILLALKNKLAVYAIHTNLDKIFGGVSFQIGRILGLQNLEFLHLQSEKIPRKKMNAEITNTSIICKEYFGLGVMGVLNPPNTWDEFSKTLVEKMNLRFMRHSAPSGKLISKIGLCGGSGSDLIQEALDKDCDVYITSDCKYHQFFMEKLKMTLVDIGHYESEQYVAQLIESIISKKFPTFALSLTKLNTNPIYYSN